MATGIASLHTDTDEVRMRNEIRQQIVAKLANKKYRDAFGSEQISTGLAFQIRAMREQRGWTQAELGEKVGMAQPRISIMEDANYARYSLKTLRRLASVFDVGLVVRFEPFSKVVDNFVALDSSALNVPDFEHDTFTLESPISWGFPEVSMEASPYAEAAPIYAVNYPQGLAGQTVVSGNLIFPSATQVDYETFPLADLNVVNTVPGPQPVIADLVARYMRPQNQGGVTYAN